MAGEAAIAAAHAAMVQAIKASGVVVQMTPENFQSLLNTLENPLIVTSEGGFLKTIFQYLVSYKGLAFYTKTPVPLLLPSGAEVVAAKSMWMPS
jgi:hypothetical protein